MPSTTKMAKPRTQKPTIKTNKNDQQSQKQEQKQAHSWAMVRGILTCKYHEDQNIINNNKQKQEERESKNNKKSKKMKCSGSLCNNTKVMQRPHDTSSSPLELHKIIKTNSNNNVESSSSSSSRSMKEVNATSTSSSLSVASSSSMSNVGSSFRGMPFRRFSGCYECRMVVDPLLGIARDPSLRGTICSCSICGEIFMNPENLELHQAVKHAVSEVGADDTSKNIVEIIFQSSWLKKQTPPLLPKIDRILKIHNTSTTLSHFESYRDSIKSKALKTCSTRNPNPNPNPSPSPRCVADGNELLRFHGATLSCPLGLNNSTSLCSLSSCRVCSLIRHGFRGAPPEGILTTATSGGAHDAAGSDGGGKRAMLVCRVIAGRVKRGGSLELDEWDSLGGMVGVYSSLDELYVFNHRAILPCFVVVYGGV